jgi:hypothetical protein
MRWLMNREKKRALTDLINNGYRQLLIKLAFFVFIPPSQPSPTGEGAENKASRLGGTGKGVIEIENLLTKELHGVKRSNSRSNTE